MFRFPPIVFQRGVPFGLVFVVLRHEVPPFCAAVLLVLSIIGVHSLYIVYL